MYSIEMGQAGDRARRVRVRRRPRRARDPGPPDWGAVGEVRFAGPPTDYHVSTPAGPLLIREAGPPWTGADPSAGRCSGLPMPRERPPGRKAAETGDLRPFTLLSGPGQYRTCPARRISGAESRPEARIPAGARPPRSEATA